MKAMKKYQDGGRPKRRTVKFTKETLETGKKGKPTKQKITKTVTKQTKKGTKTKTKQFTLDKGARKTKIQNILSGLGIVAGIPALGVNPALGAGLIGAGAIGMKGGEGKVRKDKKKTVRFSPSMQEGGMVEEAETKGQARRRIRREDRDFKRDTKRANREQEQVISPSMDAEIEAQDPVTPTRDNTPSNFPKTYTAFKQMWRSSDAGRQGVPAPSRSEFRKMKTKNQIKAIEEAKEGPKPTRKDRVLDRKMKRALKEGEKMMEASPIIEADEPDADDFGPGTDIQRKDLTISPSPIDMPEVEPSEIMSRGEMRKADRSSRRRLRQDAREARKEGKEEKAPKDRFALKSGVDEMLFDKFKKANPQIKSTKRLMRQFNKLTPQQRNELNAMRFRKEDAQVDTASPVDTSSDATPSVDTSSTTTTPEDGVKKTIGREFLQNIRDARYKAAKDREEEGLRTRRDVRKYGRITRRRGEYDTDINIDKEGKGSIRRMKLQSAKQRQEGKTQRRKTFDELGQPKRGKDVLKLIGAVLFPGAAAGIALLKNKRYKEMQEQVNAKNQQTLANLSSDEKYNELVTNPDFQTDGQFDINKLGGSDNELARNFLNELESQIVENPIKPSIFKPFRPEPAPDWTSFFKKQ